LFEVNIMYRTTLILSIFLLNFCVHADELERKLRDAYRDYQLALSDESIAYQELHFNAALSLYHEVEEQLSPDRNLGPLYYNIGNIYFYLSEYPLAIAYYYRASQTMPDNPKLIKNLNHALEKVGFGHSYTPPSITYFEALKIFGALAALTIILLSMYIWIKNKAIFFSAIGTGVIGAVFLCTAIFINAAAPVEAIVIYPGLLRKGASGDFPPISEEPLFPGMKVQILDVVRQGKWLKVATQDNEIGYLSYKTIRAI